MIVTKLLFTKFILSRQGQKVIVPRRLELHRGEKEKESRGKVTLK